MITAPPIHEHRRCYKCGMENPNHGPGLCGERWERVSPPAHFVAISFLKTLMTLPLLFTSADLQAAGLAKSKIYIDIRALSEIGWLRAEEKILTRKGKRRTVWRRLVTLRE